MSCFFSAVKAERDIVGCVVSLEFGRHTTTHMSYLPVSKYISRLSLSAKTGLYPGKVARIRDEGGKVFSTSIRLAAATNLYARRGGSLGISLVSRRVPKDQ